MVSDHVVSAAIDVIRFLFFHLFTRARLMLRLRDKLHAVGRVENVVKGLDRPTLLVEGQVTKICVSAVGLLHVALV